MVGSDTPDACESAFCSIPTRARAAFNWAAVSNAALQYQLKTSCLICSSCFKHRNCNLSHIRSYDRLFPVLVSDTTRPFHKLEASLLTYDISTIDHAW